MLDAGKARQVLMECQKFESSKELLVKCKKAAIE